MTPHKQLIKHDPENNAYGDCQRTCIAVILDLHPSEVPHFCDGRPEREDHRPWNQQQESWLAARGLALATFAYSGELPMEEAIYFASKQNPKVPMIFLGKSSLGCNHVVVIQGGEIVCDPSGNGIVGPCAEGTWEFSVIGIGG